MKAKAANGVASSKVKVPNANTGYQFTASASLSDAGTVTATSNSFDVVAGAAAKISVVGTRTRAPSAPAAIPSRRTRRSWSPTRRTTPEAVPRSLGCRVAPPAPRPTARPRPAARPRPPTSTTSGALAARRGRQPAALVAADRPGRGGGLASRRRWPAVSRRSTAARRAAAEDDMALPYLLRDPRAGQERRPACARSGCCLSAARARWARSVPEQAFPDGTWLASRTYTDATTRPDRDRGLRLVGARLPARRRRARRGRRTAW